MKKIFDITIAYESMGGEMLRPDTLEFLDKVKTVHVHFKQRTVCHSTGTHYTVLTNLIELSLVTSPLNFLISQFFFSDVE